MYLCFLNSLLTSLFSCPKCSFLIKITTGFSNKADMKKYSNFIWVLTCMLYFWRTLMRVNHDWCAKGAVLARVCPTVTVLQQLFETVLL